MIVHRLDDIIEVIDRISSPAVRLIYDTAHVQAIEGDAAAHLERVYDHIDIVQLADQPGRLEPGSGTVDFDSVLSQIGRRGFSGLVELEHSWTKPDVEASVKASIVCGDWTRASVSVCMPASAKVFVSFPVLPQVREHISKRCSAEFNETNNVLSCENLINRARGHDALMVTVTDALDRATIQRLPDETRVIATYSVGHDHIDLDAAAARGIAVLNTPGVLTDAVAELAFFLMIGAARRATESIDLIRAGRWTGWTSTQLPGMQLAGKRLGIYGMGRIGQAVAQRARAFGMKVHYTNTRRLEPQREGNATYHAEPRELLRQSDMLLLACPTTCETRGFLDRAHIEALPDGAIVVNVSRGDVVDDDALIQALTNGKLAAAGLDVFADEPQLDRRYFALPNVLMTPHIGSSTIEARVSMGAVLLDALEELARGSNPRNRLV